ncbi:glycosyltransferase family 2 protein [bacterium]|nr:glycosyltransferase family 2 protein [bacterium]
MEADQLQPRVGIVVIGRNEGERLRTCLKSLPAGIPIVYADSGSQDGSPERAKELGVDVIELDVSRPFSAARGRDEGFARLMERTPSLEYVQFLDGDCELARGWLVAAIEYLDSEAVVAVVCGRRREEAPEASLFNRLMDLEWDAPCGTVDACGGDAVVRASKLKEVGGYNAALIAGEEPEMCLRIRQLGAKIVRLDLPMSIHDSQIQRFGQWWRRQVRAGHAFAEVAVLHWRVRFRWHEVASVVVWGGGVPAAILLMMARGFEGAPLIALSYSIPWIRSIRSQRGHGRDAQSAILYATSCVVGKFAQLLGVLRFVWNGVLYRRPTSLIEYKA